MAGIFVHGKDSDKVIDSGNITACVSCLLHDAQQDSPPNLAV